MMTRVFILLMVIVLAIDVIAEDWSVMNIQLRNGKEYILDIKKAKWKKVNNIKRSDAHHVYYTLALKNKSLYVDCNGASITVGDRHGTYSGIGYGYTIENLMLGIHASPSGKRYLSNISWRF